MSRAQKKRKLEVEEVDEREAEESVSQSALELASLVCVTLTPGTGIVGVTPKLPDELMTTMFDQMNGVAPLDNFMICLNFLYGFGYHLLKLKVFDLTNQVAYLERGMPDDDDDDMMMDPSEDGADK